MPLAQACWSPMPLQKQARGARFSRGDPGTMTINGLNGVLNTQLANGYGGQRLPKKVLLLVGHLAL